jgi:hypothetical protein
MGKGERSRAENQAHNISSRQKENRRRSAGEVGEGEGAAEEDFLESDLRNHSSPPSPFATRRTAQRH